MSAMKCKDAKALVMRYLDNELNEEEAGPLRSHLLACPGCRAEVQESKVLQAWFVAPEPTPIPEGFAARVAHRAMTGNRGALVALPTSTEAPASPVEEAEGERLRGFVLTAIAVAALVLLALSIALRRLELPSGEGLEATDTSRDQAIEALRSLNESGDEE